MAKKYFSENNAKVFADNVKDYVNNKVLIAQNTAPTFTYVVNSDEALNAWANNTSGNDYTHVLIKTGTWEMSNVNGIDLTAAGTITVTGENGNLISNIYSETTTGYGLRYTALPTGDNYFIRNVNVYCKQTSSNTQLTTERKVYCFTNCKNLSNCTANGYNAFPVSGQNVVYGFSGCYNLIQCSMYIDTVSSSNPFYYGYENCEYLNECMIDIKPTIQAFVMHGFRDCYYASNCKAFTRGSQQAYAYLDCEHLSNCYGYTYCGSSSNTANQANAYKRCKYLSSCCGDGSAAYPYIYESCQHLSNCYSKAAGSVMIGFYNCNFLTCCNSYASYVNGGAKLFYNCSGMTLCTGSIGTINNNGGTAFSGCYSVYGSTDSAYSCANTPNGGFNYAPAFTYTTS